MTAGNRPRLCLSVALSQPSAPSVSRLHFPHTGSASLAGPPSDGRRAVPVRPAYYVLVAQTNALNPVTAASTTLGHPAIEYHYADDSPAALLPQFPGEHVLVLDYDSARPGPPAVKSLSQDLIVSSLKVSDAPGAAVAGEPALRNNNIYVVEIATKPVAESASPLPEEDDMSVHTVLARFKQRNAVLRHILDYPTAATTGQDPPPS
ncbi:uncharacterized protein BXZ73DRAFT_73963 [Epithele typhae]|uniref:uncharacterized protein n=1 Tax=Epithele typhae TaxID=378194 RepID=UPI0020077527|nr:uncharacterized protein BXZ73DRAFT_73963 [Epithele typhae]KAH9944450.1 hypothetical protein BXZ73DRAFT_73963 [Epithele typhae]